MRVLIALTLLLVGCKEGGGGGSAKIAAPVDAIENPVEIEPVTPPVEASNTVEITYYKVTETRSPINGWPLKTYTATGYCAEFNDEIYCWDDGLKTIPSWTMSGFTYGPYRYTFWSVHHNANEEFRHCNGGCNNGPLKDSPVDIRFTQNLISVADAANVLTGGVPVTVTCQTTEDDLVDCGDFVLY